MTIDKFVEYADAMRRKQFGWSWDPTPDRKEIEQVVKRCAPNEYDTDIIVSFYCNLGEGSFDRTETISRDKLTICLGYSCNTFYWEDIGCMVNQAGFIENCGGRIETFYISENGEFYNQNHKLIAANEEAFFDYILTVEYNHHPDSSEHTIQMLQAAGWYEGRRINITEFENKLKLRGIELSEAQRAFFAEFGDLGDLYCDEYWFYSLDQIAEKGKHKETFVCNGKSVYNVIECIGSMSGGFGIDSDGIIRFHMLGEYGRTTMECINHICENMYSNMVSRAKQYGDCELLKKMKKV